MPYAYTSDDLAWYAETFGEDEWMVHIAGPDDCILRANPDLDDDDPANPLLTEQSAIGFAAGIEKFNAWYAEQFPDDNLPPQISATIFHRGVPWTPEQNSEA